MRNQKDPGTRVQKCRVPRVQKSGPVQPLINTMNYSIIQIDNFYRPITPEFIKET